MLYITVSAPFVTSLMQIQNKYYEQILCRCTCLSFSSSLIILSNIVYICKNYLQAIKNKCYINISPTYKTFLFSITGK